jgi:hypothetical protein
MRLDAKAGISIPPSGFWRSKGLSLTLPIFHLSYFDFLTFWPWSWGLLLLEASFLTIWVTISFSRIILLNGVSYYYVFLPVYISLGNCWTNFYYILHKFHDIWDYPRLAFGSNNMVEAQTCEAGTILAPVLKSSNHRKGKGKVFPVLN